MHVLWWVSHLITAVVETDLWRIKVSYACQILLANRHSLYIEHRMARWDEGGVRNTEQKVVKGWQEGCASAPDKGRWRWARKLRQVNDTSVRVLPHLEDQAVEKETCLGATFTKSKTWLIVEIFKILTRSYERFPGFPIKADFPFSVCHFATKVSFSFWERPSWNLLIFFVLFVETEYSFMLWI